MSRRAGKPYSRQLHSLLDRHFDRDELRLLCFDLGIDPDNLRGGTKTLVAMELVLRLEREERLGELASLIHEKRPQLTMPAVVEATEEELDRLDAPPSPEESSKTASQGLRSLVEILKESSAAREAVARFGADFQGANERIDLLGGYKDLHDLLHKLQFQCYNRIVQLARRFPADEFGLEDLEDHRVTLQNITRSLRRSIQETTERQPEGSFDSSWIQKLVDAQTALKQAIEARERESLERAIWLLNRVLAYQPATIDARLMETVDTLRLPDLVGAMSSVHDTLAGFELDEYELRRVELGVSALGDLNESLTSQVDEHNRWQQLDLELRRIDGSLKHDTLDLKFSWPDLKKDVENLLGERTGEWVEELRKNISGLDGGMESDDPVLLRKHFRNFRWRVANRFYEVDADLKDLCGNMREVALPLASMMRVLG